MRKTIAIGLTLLLIVGLSFVGLNKNEKVYAKSAQLSLHVPDQVQKEETFVVRVSLDSDIELFSVDAYLSYSADTLEFVPSDDAVTGAAGVLELKDMYGEETKTAEYEITFKALATGPAEIAFTDVYLIDYADLDYVEVAPSAKHFEVEVNEDVAEDARLSELIVAPGVMTEEFRPNRLNYEMHVGLDVEQVGVSAIPMEEDSIVEVEIPEQLQDGENRVVVTVTAPSGNVNVYRVNVIRDDWGNTEELLNTEESTEIIPQEPVTESNMEEAPKEIVPDSSEETIYSTTELTTEMSTEEASGEEILPGEPAEEKIEATEIPVETSTDEREKETAPMEESVPLE